ncbi:MAG: ribonuclease H family protein [Nitrososphaerales archaeon]
MANALIENYNDNIIYYTDASKTQSKRVGIGCYCPQFKVEISHRLTDNISICAGEMYAIKTAIASYTSLINEDSEAIPPLVIFSDSLSAIKSIKTKDNSSRPDIIKDIYQQIETIERKVTLVWIPSHVGILGNETVDKLANKATENTNIYQDIGITINDVKTIVLTHIKEKWQSKWINNKTDYRNIESEIGWEPKFIHQNRNVERLIFRLRAGHCKLNYYMYKLHLHPTGRCDECGEDETVEHFLTKCPRSKLAIKIREICQQQSIICNVPNVLTNKNSIKYIIKLCNRNL